MKMQFDTWLKRGWGILPILFALLLTWFGGLSWLDHAIYDAQIRLLPPNEQARGITHPLSDNTVIVAIDEASLQHFGRWPWSRDLQAQLLDQLTAAQVRAVGFDIMLSEADDEHPAADQRLAQAIQRNGRVVLPVGFARMEERGQLIEIMPHPIFIARAAGLGHVLMSHDSDNVVRRCWLYAGLGNTVWPHFSAALLRLADHRWQLSDVLTNDQVVSAAGRNAVAMQQDKPTASFWTLDKKNPIGIDFRQLDTPTPVFSAADVLQGRVTLGLRDKIVLVGVTAPGIVAGVSTPIVSERESGLSGVELLALGVRTLAANSEINTLDVPKSLLIVFVFMLLLRGSCARAQSKIRKHLLLFHGLALLSASALSLILMWGTDLWFAPSALLAGIVLSYLMGSSKQLRHMTRAASTDALTGLANRQRLSEFAHTELRRAQRAQSRVALLVLDIDFFKAYNDHYGHPQGDSALRALGDVLRQSIRSETDLAARFGGEEFAVLLTLQSAHGAEAYAQRLRDMLAQANIPHAKAPLKRLTISMGLAISENGSAHFSDLYDAADRSLYEAKHSGRDRLGSITYLNAAQATALPVA